MIEVETAVVVAPEPLKVSKKLSDIDCVTVNVVIVESFKSTVAASFLEGNIIEANTFAPEEPLNANPKNSFVLFRNLYPPKANTLQMVTEPAFLKYSLAV